MAIVQDVAHEATTQHNIQFYKPQPETHVGFAYDAPVDNTADAWVPLQETVFDETP